MTSPSIKTHRDFARVFAIVLLLLLATSIGACNKNSSDGNDGELVSGAASGTDLRSLIGPYEAIRRKLLNNETNGIKEEADRIAEVAAKNANPTSVPIARAAKKLSSQVNDLEAARLAFGDLSQQLIEVLSKDSQLKEELHLFNCPMAKGYGQWVQSDDKLGNPYMGQHMPGCGSRAEW